MAIRKVATVPGENGVCAASHGYLLAGPRLWKLTKSGCGPVKELDCKPSAAFMGSNSLLAGFPGLLLQIPLDYKSDCADPGHSDQQVLWKGTDPEVPTPLWIWADGRSAAT